MYHHTQSGTVTRLAALAGVGVAVLVLARFGSSPALWFLVGVAVLGVLALSSMTIEVDQERLRFWFGVGVIGRSFRLAEIQTWTAVTNPWWYGWGIHLTPQGWLYNVGGARAVQLELQDGRRLRVGTDEPERLCEVITAMKGGGRA
jgi:hypothetical protein